MSISTSNMYTNVVYGSNFKGQFSITDINDSFFDSTEHSISTEDLEKYFVDLEQYVPPFIYRVIDNKKNELIKVVDDMYKLQGTYIGMCKYFIEDLIAQCFARTATWSLPIWEREYAIPIDDTLTDEERQGRLLAKMRSIGPFNFKMVNNIANAYNSEVSDIIEYTKQHHFNIIFFGSSNSSNITNNIRLFRDSINEVKPAHLSWDISIGIADKLVLKTKTECIKQTFPMCGDNPVFNKEMIMDVKTIYDNNNIVLHTNQEAYIQQFPTCGTYDPKITE